MYTKEQEQLRISLNQFFGAILVNSNYSDPNLAKQSLIALTIEELLKFCKNEDQTIDIVAAKPILRGAHYIIEQRECNIVDKLRSTSLSEEEIEEATADLEWIKNDLEKYISSLK